MIMYYARYAVIPKLCFLIFFRGVGVVIDLLNLINVMDPCLRKQTYAKNLPIISSPTMNSGFSIPTLDRVTPKSDET